MVSQQTRLGCLKTHLCGKKARKMAFQIIGECAWRYIKRRRLGEGDKYKRKRTYGARGGEIAGGKLPVVIEIETEVCRVLRGKWGGTGETDKRVSEGGKTI